MDGRKRQRMLRLRIFETPKRVREPEFFDGFLSGSGVGGV